MASTPTLPVGPHASKFVPERLEVVIRALEQGRTIGVACARADISRRTFDRWVQKALEQKVDDWRKYSDFMELAARTMLAFQDSLEGVVSRAAIAGDVKAAFKLLEKIDEEHWGPKRASTVAIEAQAGSSVNVVVTPVYGHVDPADIFRKKVT